MVESLPYKQKKNLKKDEIDLGDEQELAVSLSNSSLSNNEADQFDRIMENDGSATEKDGERESLD